MKPYVESVYKIYSPEGDGAFLEVGPDSDGLDMIEVRTTDKASEEWFGKFRFGVPKDMAKALGEILIKASQESEK